MLKSFINIIVGKWVGKHGPQYRIILTKYNFSHTCMCWDEEVRDIYLVSNGWEKATISYAIRAKLIPRQCNTWEKYIKVTGDICQITEFSVNRFKDLKKINTKLFPYNKYFISEQEKIKKLEKQ